MNNKMKYLFGLTAVTLLSLSACSRQPQDNKNPYEGLEAETSETILNDLTVVHAEDGVYGNIRLPEKSNGATISWWSSNPDVINPKYNGEIAPGEVKRQGEEKFLQPILVILFGISMNVKEEHP